MLKKIMVLGAAIAALVAIAAPAAQAVELSDSEGVLEVGSEVTGTSSDLTTVVTGVGTLKCELVTVHMLVTENGPTQVVAEEVATTTKGCTVPITDPTVKTLTLNNSGGGSASGVFFAADGPLNCNLGGGLGVTYVTNTDVISVSGSLKGTCGEGHMNGSFTLETSNGEAVTIG